MDFKKWLNDGVRCRNCGSLALMSLRIDSDWRRNHRFEEVNQPFGTLDHYFGHDVDDTECPDVECYMCLDCWYQVDEPLGDQRNLVEAWLDSDVRLKFGYDFVIGLTEDDDLSGIEVSDKIRENLKLKPEDKVIFTITNKGFKGSDYIIKDINLLSEITHMFNLYFNYEDKTKERLLENWDCMMNSSKKTKKNEVVLDRDVDSFPKGTLLSDIKKAFENEYPGGKEAFVKDRVQKIKEKQNT